MPYPKVSTPIILQIESVECGAVSLAIILAYYGRFAPIEELRIKCGVSRDGSKASNILKAARSYGLDAQGWKLEVEEFLEIKYPCIVFWKFNHFVVVEGWKKNTVYLNDPALGRTTVSFQEFDENFTGVALTFNKNENFTKENKRKSLINSLHFRLNGSYVAINYAVLASLALAITGIAIPLFIKIFIDDFLIKGLKSWVQILLIGILFTVTLRALLTWLQQSVLLKLKTKLAIVQSNKFFWHVLRLPIEFFNQRYAGDIAQRIDTNSIVAQLISSDFTVNFVNIVTIFVCLIIMSCIDLQLTFISILFIILNFLSLNYVTKKRRVNNLKLVQERGNLLAITMGSLQAIEIIKATGGEEESFLRWVGYEANVLNLHRSVEVYSRILSTIPFVLTMLLNALILGLGGLRVMNGDLSVGMLFAFRGLVLNLSLPIQSLVNFGNKFQEMEGTVNLLDDVSHAKQDIVFEKNPHTTAQISQLTGHIEFDNVTFGYSPLEPPLVENFNLRIKPGSRTALVGATGSGKSTLIKLLIGLQSPWAGEIKFDGCSREQIPQSVFTRSISVVDQDVFLFEGSVRDNMTLGDSTRSQVDMVHASKDALIHKVIMNHEHGYEPEVGEGGNQFSAGERQRLELARALTSNPSILILDEATSCLDPITEKMIDDNLKMRLCTCLIVAHRLSTIRDCDEIIVLEKGKIIEQGKHEDLIKRAGSYARLVKLEELT